MLKISTFGGLNITHNKNNINGLITRKVEALLVYLLCNPRECSRETLGDFFWDDLPQSRTMGNLRTAISNLKQNLGDYLYVTRHTVAFDICQLHWVDAMQLENTIQQARQHRQLFGHLSRPIAKQLADAVSLYQGDFLEGFYIKNGQGFEDWKTQRQEYYRLQTLLALQWLIDYHIEQQQYTRAIEYANRLLEINPLLEEGHRYLMQLYSLTQQRSAALMQYTQCMEILQRELHVEPEQATRDLYQRILTKAPDQIRPVKTAHNLPSHPTPFVPRPDLLSGVLDNLRDPACALLTLVGMGGAGKTRLALQAGREMLADYRDGVYFIDLAGATSAEFIPAVIVNTLEIPYESDQSLRKDLMEYLEDKHMLLIFDNFEQCLDASDLVANLLAKAPQLNILVTSREKLNLYGEWVVYVEGFARPASERVEDHPGVALFLNTARRVSPAFKLAGNEAAILDICQWVEGLPLAIELAAGWSHIMPCSKIAEQIRTDLKIFDAPLKNVPERHRGMWALFENSWLSLSVKEQQALLGLSLFRSRFDLNAAAQATNASPTILSILSDKCLVKVVEPGWYEIHSLLRQYIGDKLRHDPAQAALQSHYARYFVDWIPYQSPSQIDPYYDDIRTLLEQLQGDFNLELCAALNDYWRRKGYLTEARYWLTAGLEQAEVSEIRRAAALANLGEMAWAQGDFDIAERYMLEALPLLEAYECWVEYCDALNHLGHVNLNRGEHNTARAYYERMLRHAETTNNQEVYALALGNMGLLYSDTNNLEEAAVYFQRSIEINRKLGKTQRMAVLMNNLGTIMLTQQQNHEAKRCYEEAYALAQSGDNVVVKMICQVNLGEVSHNLGDYQLALQHYHDGLQTLITLGDKVSLISILESIAFLLIDLQQVQWGVQILGTMDAARDALSAPISPREKPRLDRFVSKAQAHLPDYQQVYEHERLPSLDDAVNQVLNHLTSLVV